MDQKNVISQMQQLSSEWLKLVTDATTRFATGLTEVEKLEKQGVAKALSAVEEASQVAKDAIAATEQLSGQWRKAVHEYAQRTLDLIAPAN